MITLKMSKESPGRELRDNELALLPGVDYVGPGTVFEAPDEWYHARRHWQSLSVVEVGEEDEPDQLTVPIVPSTQGDQAKYGTPAPVLRPQSNADLNVDAMSYRELQAALRDRNLSPRGSTLALRARLTEHLEQD